MQAKDAIGRTWQMSTIQLDFQTPQRFGMHYVGADNERHPPIMIHRALFGSIERFFAVLVEHYAGAFPAWLAPVQATVLPVADRHDDVRVPTSPIACSAEGSAPRWSTARHGALGARIRRAKTEKVPYVLVVGDDDVETRHRRRQPAGERRPRHEACRVDDVHRASSPPKSLEHR